MAHHHQHTPIWGIILVALGLILLLGTLDLFFFHWSLILLITGILLFVLAFSSEDKGGVFPGSILLMLGLFYYLRFHGVMDDPWYLLWPIFPTIIGAAFLILFIFRPGDWGLLIPAGILLFLGLLFFANVYDIICWNPLRLIQRYWPLILILVGAKLLLSARKKG